MQDPPPVRLGPRGSLRKRDLHAKRLPDNIANLHLMDHQTQSVEVVCGSCDLCPHSGAIIREQTKVVDVDIAPEHPL